MRLLFFLSVLIAPLAFSLPENKAVDTLILEWSRLAEHVENLTPDGLVGGVYHEKVYDDVSLMWKMDDENHQIIRIYAEQPDGRPFHITYYKSRHILNDHLVLRRFLGEDPGGWKAHTIDFEKKEYLGTQGLKEVKPTQNQHRILNHWKISNF